MKKRKIYQGKESVEKIIAYINSFQPNAIRKKQINNTFSFTFFHH